MADYVRMYEILQKAVQEELPMLRCVPKAYAYAAALERAMEQEGEIAVQYATLCGAISDGLDGLNTVPLAHQSAKHLQSALEAAEEEYIRSSE